MSKLRAYRIELKYLTLTTLLVVALLRLNHMGAFARLDVLVADFIFFMNTLGVIGVFGVAVVGNTTLVVQVPYTSMLIPPALTGASLGEMAFWGMVAGLGAGLGETFSYGLVDRLLRLKPDIENSQFVQMAKNIEAKHPRLIRPLIVVWTALPIFPDDAIIVSLAMIKYGLWRIMPPLLVGKLVHNLVVALAIYYFTDAMALQLNSDSQTALVLGFVIGFFLLIFYQIERARTALAPQ